MTAGPQERSAVVIGAGIVGVCSALWLRRAGFTVTLVDRLGPGEACSHGNAGMMSPQQVVPFALPDLIWKVPRWLTDPVGPVALDWRYLPRALPWLVRFLRSSRAESAMAVSRAMQTLHRDTYENYAPLVEEAGAAPLLRRMGQLHVTGDVANAAGSVLVQEMRRIAGARVEVVGENELRQLEPDLARRYKAGVFFPDHGHCVDPGGFVKALAAAFVRGGGRLVRGEVRGFARDAEGVSGVELDGETIAARRVVIAAGAWSHRLTAQLGLELPLEAERGYHVVLPNPGVSPRRAMSNRDRGFAATPMAAGLRIAGTVEIAGVDAPANWRRADILIEHAKEMFPGVNTEGAVRWMGCRPALPDELPAIDRLPGHPGVILAFGSGHYGLTQGSTIGKLTAELLTDRTPSIDLAPFRATRFA
jgi:D-amino-acid dehydrogenase